MLTAAMPAMKPSRPGGPSTPLADRLWKKVAIGAPEECWSWLGARNPRGYGKIALDRHHFTAAHRAAWMLTKGPIPDGMLVCHRCDNPGCCNPAHLFLGTHEENMADMIAKGRSLRGPRVTHCPRGHEYDEANTYVRGNKRACRSCNREKAREAKARGEQVSA